MGDSAASVLSDKLAVAPIIQEGESAKDGMHTNSLHQWWRRTENHRMYREL